MTMKKANFILLSLMGGFGIGDRERHELGRTLNGEILDRSSLDPSLVISIWD
jgi:hypothetical protein